MNNQPQNARVRNLCFTINNPTAEHRARIISYRENGTAVFVVYGNEVGDNGTPHLQGYIEFARQLRFSQARALLPGAHLEPRRGSQAQAIAYCKKDGDFVEDGVPRAQGARNDLREVKSIIQRNPGNWKPIVADEYFGQYVRYFQGFAAAAKALNQEEVTADFKLTDFDKEPLVFTPGQPFSHVLHGPSGIGKTQFALAHFENPLFVSHMDDLLAFSSDNDGIVFDDMSFSHLPRVAQIHLVDSDQTRSIHCRYRTARIPRRTPKIFTTNEAFGAIFTEDTAINRRITITEMEEGLWILPPVIPQAPPLPDPLLDLPDAESDDDVIILLHNLPDPDPLDSDSDLEELPANQLQAL